MSGDVSDPFCVFYVKDLRSNSGMATAKKVVSAAAAAGGGDGGGGGGGACG